MPVSDGDNAGAAPAPPAPPAAPVTGGEHAAQVAAKVIDGIAADVLAAVRAHPAYGQAAGQVAVSVLAALGITV